MVNDAILVGLRNALDRGEEAEIAMKTMISSGYDRFEVNESAKAILKERSDAELSEESKIAQMLQTQQITQPKLSGQPQQTAVSQPNKKDLLIGVIICLLLVASGLIYVVITKFK